MEQYAPPAWAGDEMCPGWPWQCPKTCTIHRWDHGEDLNRARPIARLYDPAWGPNQLCFPSVFWNHTWVFKLEFDYIQWRTIAFTDLNCSITVFCLDWIETHNKFPRVFDSYWKWCFLGINPSYLQTYMNRYWGRPRAYPRWDTSIWVSEYLKTKGLCCPSPGCQHFLCSYSWFLSFFW